VPPAFVLSERGVRDLDPWPPVAPGERARPSVHRRRGPSVAGLPPEDL